MTTPPPRPFLQTGHSSCPPRFHRVPPLKHAASGVAQPQEDPAPRLQPQSSSAPRRTLDPPSPAGPSTVHVWPPSLTRVNPLRLGSESAPSTGYAPEPFWPCPKPPTCIFHSHTCIYRAPAKCQDFLGAGESSVNRTGKKSLPS